jgi:predicted DNA-binding transcriptional regulator AlpA
VTPDHLALTRARNHMVERLEKLEPRLVDGDSSVWIEYAQLAAALATIGPAITPEAQGRLLTTRELASRLGLATKTVLAKAKRGEIGPPIRMGRRGRGAIRWEATR